MDKYNSVLNKEDYDEQYIRFGSDIIRNDQEFILDSNRKIGFIPPIITNDVLDVYFPIKNVYNRISAISNIVIDNITLISSNPDVQKFTPLKIFLGKIGIEYSPVNEEFVVMDNYEVLENPPVNVSNILNCRWKGMRTYNIDIDEDIESIIDIVRYKNYIYILWSEDPIRHLSRFNLTDGDFELDWIAPDDGGQTRQYTYLQSGRDEGTINQVILVQQRVPNNDRVRIYNLITGALEISRDNVTLIGTQISGDRLYVYSNYEVLGSHGQIIDLYIKDGYNEYQYFSGIGFPVVVGLNNEYRYVSTIYSINGIKYVYSMMMNLVDPETITILRNYIDNDGMLNLDTETLFVNSKAFYNPNPDNPDLFVYPNLLDYAFPFYLDSDSMPKNEIFLGGSNREFPNITIFLYKDDNYYWSFYRYDREYRKYVVSQQKIFIGVKSLVSRFSNTAYFTMPNNQVVYISLDTGKIYNLFEQGDYDIVSGTAIEISSFDSEYYIVCKSNNILEPITNLNYKGIVLCISENTRTINQMYKLTVNFGERVYPFSVFSAGISNVRIALANLNKLIDFELYQYIFDVRLRISKDRMTINPPERTDGVDDKGKDLSKYGYRRLISSMPRRDDSVEAMLGLVGDDFKIADFLNIYTTK
jgi:hypothetical protein